MDLASKIKILKEENQRLEEERIRSENQIKELKALVEDNKKKQQKIEDLKKAEADLLAQF